MPPVLTPRAQLQSPEPKMSPGSSAKESAAGSKNKAAELISKSLGNRSASGTSGTAKTSPAQQALFARMQRAAARIMTFNVTVYKLPVVAAAVAKATEPVVATVPAAGEAVAPTGPTTTTQNQAVSTQGNTAGLPGGAVGVASLVMKQSDVLTFRLDTTLAMIRKEMETKGGVEESFRFCTELGALSSEDSSINDYFASLSVRPRMDDVSFRFFVTDGPVPAAKNLISVLDKPPFLLKFVKLTEHGEVNAGTLHSDSIKGQNPSGLKMSEVRKLITGMSINPKIEEFCLANGTPMGEDMTLVAYLEMTGLKAPATPEKTPTVLILYHPASATTAAGGAAAASKYHAASPEIQAALAALKPDLTFTDRSAHELKADKSALVVQETLNPASFAASGVELKKWTSDMTENDWATVIRNSNLMYGWRVDFQNKVIGRAPKPAFRLKEGLNLPEVAEAPKQETKVESPADTKPKGIQSDNASEASSNGSLETPDTDISLKKLPANKKEEISKPNSASDLLGKDPIQKSGGIPSYLLNDRSKIEIISTVHEFQESMAKNHFSKSSLSASISGGYAGFSAGATAGVASESSQAQTFTTKTTHKTIISSYKFPRVTVNIPPEDLEPTDELKKALMLVETTKSISHLRKLHHDFGHLFCHQVELGGCLQTSQVISATEKTTEAQVKDSFQAKLGVVASTPGGVGGSLEASHENQDSSDDFRRDKRQNESLVFEATGGNTILAANPPAWCGSVADFNTWRVIDQSALSPLPDAIAGLGPKYAIVKQWFMQAIPKLDEYLLVPDTRCLTVRLKLNADTPAMKKILGSDVPAYLAHDPEHPPAYYKTSLKAFATIEAIKGDAKLQVSSGKIMCDTTKFCDQSQFASKDTVFFPTSTQAPVLIQPTEYKPVTAMQDLESKALKKTLTPDEQQQKDKADKDAAEKRALNNELTQWDTVGTAKDALFQHTLWDLEVPHGSSLGNDTLVTIVSRNVKPSGGRRVLAVYRNAQGVFLPCISSSDVPSYFRILTKSPQALRSGDAIRLCWQFSDQPGGYRDFTQDVYGRRRTTKPADLGPGKETRLFLKVPFPSFGGAAGSGGTGLGLLLSTSSDTVPIWETVKLLKPGRELEREAEAVRYTLYDMEFRLDEVGNNGDGDKDDFMNHIVAGHLEHKSTNRYVESVEHHFETGGPIDTLGTVLFGAAAKMAGPVLRTLSKWFTW